MSWLNRATVAAHKALGQNKGFSVTGELIGDHGTTPPLQELLDLIRSWVTENAWSFEHVKLHLSVVRCHIPARSFRGLRVVGYRPHTRTSLEVLMRPEGSLRQYRGYLNCGSGNTAFVLLATSRPEVVQYALLQQSDLESIDVLHLRRSRGEGERCVNLVADKADQRWRRFGKRQWVRQLAATLLNEHPDGALSKTDIERHLQELDQEATSSQLDDIINMLVVRGLIDPILGDINDSFRTSPVLDEYANEWRLRQNREAQERTKELLGERLRELRTERINLERLEARCREARERVGSLESQTTSLQERLESLDQEHDTLASE